MSETGVNIYSHQIDCCCKSIKFKLTINSETHSRLYQGHFWKSILILVCSHTNRFVFIVENICANGSGSMIVRREKKYLQPIALNIGKQLPNWLLNCTAHKYWLLLESHRQIEASLHLARDRCTHIPHTRTHNAQHVVALCLSCIPFWQLSLQTFGRFPLPLFHSLHFFSFYGRNVLHLLTGYACVSACIQWMAEHILARARRTVQYRVHIRSTDAKV